MKKIAVLVAMSMEESYLVKRIEEQKPETVAGAKFLHGRIGEAEVILHRCGWGMRNADRGARALIGHAKPDALILYGVSGGLVPDVRVADTVAAVSSFPAFGKVRKAENTDARLTGIALRVIPEARKAPIATSIGIILRKKRKAKIVAESGAVCIDMESYAVAKAANEMGVPLLVIRSLSDTLEPSSLLEFFKNGRVAAENAAAGVEAVIKSIVV
ncbi:MAG: 5'-methylthioadenosine/S-adenosylhomocysteine nucleosidase [Oscillospiraceae bacterium]|nr:5'-methylthioadenosine/S-adenosylhomocysteine nucleosidase [Oscillospiraceae bacterium]